MLISAGGEIGREKQIVRVAGLEQSLDGSPADVVDLLLGWQQRGVDGVRLRPAVNATDLPVIVDEVVPLLQRAKRFRTSYRDGETLRRRLGLPVADNRYARVKPS